ncbi:MAG: serine/threonine-protein phosphatase [bacterium]|nr:serine/threonine-protein phosphatase [bacterium]
MAYSSHNSSGSSYKDKKFTQTIKDDVRHGDIKRSFGKDLKDVYNFYLDDETRKRLSEMSKLKRWLFVAWWVLKSMFFKLTPFRRILFLIGIVLTFTQQSTTIGQTNTNLKIGFLFFLLIIILELKDKLLAQDELKTGREVQLALLPDSNPVFPGWDIWMYTKPANDVGGDIVDYLEIDERLGVTLGDVAGKGLGAALFMAKFQATLRALAPGSSSMEELAAVMNKIFLRDGLPEKFVSLIYLELMPDKGNIDFLNAGHFPPVVIRDSGVEELPRGGNALGLSLKSSYKEQSVELKEDEIFMVYSDGLTEARNVDGDFFGDKRFMDMLPGLQKLSAEDSAKRILKVIDRFVGDAPQNDDLSLIIIKRI